MGYTKSLEYGWALLRMHWDHPDFKEGPRAFVEKATPCGRPAEQRRASRRRTSQRRETVYLRRPRRRRSGTEVQAFLAAHARRPFSSSTRVRPTSTSDGSTVRSASATGWRSAGRRRSAVSGKPPVYEFILWDEMAYARAARPPIGRGSSPRRSSPMEPTSRRSASCRGCGRGDLFFSLGYSEPEAGSDLGGLRTRAVRDGDRYVVTGEKRWTSAAHRADYLWLLCRTGTLESRARGLTLLDRRPAVARDLDLADPGDRRRAVQRGPARRCRGAGCQSHRRRGRSVAADRRLAGDRAPRPVPPRAGAARLRGARGVGPRSGLDGDPVVRHHLAGLAVEVAEVEALALEMLQAVQDGRSAVVEAASNKLWGSEVCQRVARLATELGAPEALVRGCELEFLWRQTMSETIGGGTSEIIRGLIARTRWAHGEGLTRRDTNPSGSLRPQTGFESVNTVFDGRSARTSTSGSLARLLARSGSDMTLTGIKPGLDGGPGPCQMHGRGVTPDGVSPVRCGRGGTPPHRRRR